MGQGHDTPRGVKTLQSPAQSWWGGQIWHGDGDTGPSCTVQREGSPGWAAQPLAAPPKKSSLCMAPRCLLANQPLPEQALVSSRSLGALWEEEGTRGTCTSL